ncbi:unnamed protein product [Caenorhabditis sp. 36 PRJEB53466]|nr:unnamed protein product [Caenorhabditis sp. 36 PRJEB53466]
MFLLFVVALFLLVPVTGFYYNPTLYVPKYREYLEAQTNLTNDLFVNYDPTISPIYTWVDSKKPLGWDPEAPNRWNYTLFLYYLKLVEVQEPEEKVGVVLELMEYWYDARLSWNASLYHNISAFYVRQDRVWSPTLSAFGVNDIVDFRDQDFRFVCAGNLGLIYDYLSGNSEWNLINLTNRVETLKYNDDFGNMDLAIFEIKIRRNPLYYIYMIVFPSFIINFVSIVGVFIKGADKMSRLNVGLTNIMTMTFILGVMADKIPRTGSIPLLGIYIIANLVIMLIAIAIVTFITELRRWATPRLKLKKSQFSRHLETFLGPPLEYTCAILLELMTSVNFLTMIGFWIDDE